MGLLLRHICKKGIGFRVVKIYPDLIQLSDPTRTGTGGGGKKSEIQTFSAKSRYDLFRLIHSIRFDTVHFITLTYPSKFPDDAQTCKKHLREFRRRYELRYGKTPCIWRMEYQRRAAVHFHLLYFDLPYTPISDLQNIWNDATCKFTGMRPNNSLDFRPKKREFPHGIPKDQQRLIAAYMAKYITKVDQAAPEDGGNKPGRFWGKWNIPEPIPLEVEITLHETDQLVTYLMDRHVSDRWQPDDPSICTYFGQRMGCKDEETSLLSFLRELRAGRVPAKQETVTKLT